MCSEKWGWLRRGRDVNSSLWVPCRGSPLLLPAPPCGTQGTPLPSPCIGAYMPQCHSSSGIPSGMFTACWLPLRLFFLVLYIGAFSVRNPEGPLGMETSPTQQQPDLLLSLWLCSFSFEVLPSHYHRLLPGGQDVSGATQTVGK